MLKTQQTILTNYLSLATEIRNKIAIVKSSIDRFSFIRLMLLLVEVGIFVAFVSDINELITWLTGILLIAPVLIFAVVVKKQNILIKEEGYLKQLLWVYTNEVNLINGKPNGYDNGSSFEDENHHYLSDLDIFGK